MRKVLIDTGPLVALIDQDDADHPRCVAASSQIRATAVTTWPAITEAAYLLASVSGGQKALLDMLDSGEVEVLELSRADVAPMSKLMSKYEDQPMELADASLVRVAEREGITKVFTLDAHFKVYRLPGNRRFVTLPI